MSRIFAEGSGAVKNVSETLNTNSNTTLTNVGGVYYIGMGVTGTGIPDNTYVTATALASDELTISQDATATGTPFATFNKTNYDTATNPRFKTFNAYSGSERLYTIVYEQTPSGSAETLVQQLAGSDSADTEYSNLETTEGFKIISYDFSTTVGLELSMNLTNDNYFVLIHSDDYTKHHFARITSAITENNTNTDGSIENTTVGFEFEPKLGTEIERDTKFMVFKGPPVVDTARACKLLAVSAGIKKDLQNDLVCAKPLFYFFNDNLDKDNQLDHNTKYFMKFLGANATTVTPSVTNTFVTVSDNKAVIKDYSKYTHNIKIVDNLKNMDYPAYKEGGTNLPLALVNEWNGSGTHPTTVPSVFTDYNDCFPNARRDSDLDISSTANINEAGQSAQVFTGPIRYVHYDFSPTRANKAYNVFNLNVLDSSENRGSYLDCQMIDNKRIIDSKITRLDKLRIRHRLHKGKFNDWFELKAKIKSNLGSNEYRFTTEYDLATMFNVGDELRIGNEVLIVEVIDSINNSGTTGKEQDITFRAVHRLETEAIFASSSTYTLAVGASIYRRAWNSTDGTLLTDFDIIENRNNNLYIKLISSDFGFLDATVTNSDANKQLLTLSFAGTSHSGSDTALDYMDGSFYIEVEKFSGAIEKIHKTKKDGQTIFTIAGRSEVRRLLGPIINKNTLHSEDIIYSSNSPFERLEYAGGAARTVTCNFGSQEVQFSDTHGLSVDDHIYLLHDSHGTITYIGQVDALGDSGGSNLTTYVQLLDNSLAESSTNPTDEDVGLVAKSDFYVFNKALSSNRAIDSTATLAGASTKGLYFTGGNTLIANGSESTSLVGSSSSTNAKARGYYLSDCLSILSDGKFQARLDDNASGTTASTDKTYQNFDTINSLIDFTVLSKTIINNRTTLELAPHIPLTLGRVDINYANVKDTTFNATTLGVVSASTIGNMGFYTTAASASYNALSTTASARKYHGEPLYANGVFIGRMIMANANADNTVSIYIDTPLTADIDGQTIQTISATGNFGETTKLTHELNMLNGGHLHGGKVIGLVNSYVRNGGSAGANKALLMNYPLRYVNASAGVNQASDNIEAVTYIEKYGAPLYRIYNLEQGNYNRVANSSGVQYVSDFITTRYYTETLSKIPFYASAYKINFGYSLIGTTYDSRITGVGKTDKTVNNHILPESRGLTNVAGSRFFDTITHKKNASAEDVIFNTQPSTQTPPNPFMVKDILNQIDPKVTRMFLFANSDKEPYSSTRHDSLLYGTQTRKISDYSFFGLQNPSPTTNSDTKESMLGLTSTINLTDDDYVTSSIVSSSKTLSSLKRFSLMRLTEVVFDWAFNQIDPENAPSSSRVLPIFTYASYDWTLLTGGSGYWQSSTNDQVEIADYSGSTLTADADVSAVLLNNDLVIDSNGRLIGQVASVGGAGNTVITFNAAANKTNGNAYFVGDLYKVTALIADDSSATSNCTIVYGHGTDDTFVNHQKQIHMLKSIVIRNTTEYGVSGQSFHDVHGAGTGLLNSSSNANRSANTYLPISMNLRMANVVQGGTGNQDSTISNGKDPSKIMKLIGSMSPISSSGGTNIDGEDALYNAFLPLFLDRFSVEDGSNRIEKGTVGQSVQAASRVVIKGGNSTDIILVGLGLNNNFQAYEDNEGAAATYDKHADGVMLTFKPRLYIEETPTTNKSAGNRDVYTYVIQPSTDITTPITFSSSSGAVAFSDINRESLRVMNDLTGCYLVGENGKYLSDAGVETSHNHVIGSAALADGIGMDAFSPDTVAYVISHEIDTTHTTEKHIIITDKALTAGFNRIMQPNHTCFYDFSPKEIALNTLSSKYTKVSGEDRCYESIGSYLLSGNKVGPRYTVFDFLNTGRNEAALSMYLPIDLDAQSDSEYIVLREGNKFESILTGNESYSMCISDGINPFKSTIEYVDNGLNIGHTLKLSDIKEQLGVVSISETFTLNVGEKIDTDIKRGMIGSTVTICSEAEDLVNELLESEGIEFANTTAEYPLFVSPNYQGIDLFSAVNFLLSKKDKTLFHDNDTFQIKAKEDSFFNTGVFISDASDVELYDYEKEEDLFNLKNEVVVYGKLHKAVRSDFTSIKEDGKKTLEIYDTKLNTQEEVNTRASEELQIHTSLNERIEIEVGHKQLSQTKAGDIIELEIPRENVKRNTYKIIQAEHLLTGNMKLQLGRYSKVLEDRFSDLSIETKKIRSSIRDVRFDESNVGYVSSTKVKIKPIRLIIRERKSNGGLVFGFGATLNTNSRTFGFGQSLGVTHTTLLEEEY